MHLCRRQDLTGLMLSQKEPREVEELAEVLALARLLAVLAQLAALLNKQPTNESYVRPRQRNPQGLLCTSIVCLAGGAIPVGLC